MAKPIPTFRASVFSTTSAASYAASPSYTPAAGSLLVAFVESSLASSPINPTSVTGHGVTFSSLSIAGALSTTHRVSVWVADSGAAPTAVATTASFGSTNQSGCSIIEYEITGVDLSGGAVAAIVQSPVNTGTGTTGTVTLSAAGNSENIELAAFVHLANEGTTPRTNWTEPVGSDGNFNAPATGVEAQYRTDTFETTVSATWATSSAWLGVALEIKAALAQVGVGLLGLTGLAPALGFALLVSAGALSLAGPTPTAPSGQLVPTGTLTLTGAAPAQRFTGPDTGSLAFAGAAPTLLIRAITITPAAGSLILSGTTATVIQAGSPAPASAALTLAGQQPARVLGGQVAIVPGVGALAFVGSAPAHSFLGPAEASLALAGTTPTPSIGTPGGGTTVLPGVGSLAFASDDIEVQFLGPDVGSLTFTGLAPTLFATPVSNPLVTPGVGVLTLAGGAPSPLIFGALTPAAGALTLSGTTLTLSVTSTGLVPSATLALSGATPTASLFGPFVPATGSLTLTGQTPTAPITPTVVPATGTLSLTGQTPTRLLTLQVMPATATLTLASAGAPSLAYGGIAQPGPGLLTLTGQTPVIAPSRYLPPTGTLTLTGQQPALFGNTTGPLSTFVTWMATSTLTTWTAPQITMTTWGAS
jgi:hypothetical protein